MFILVMLFFFQNRGAIPVDLKELYSETVLSSVRLPHRTAWLSFEARTRVPNNNLYIFDHDSHQIYHIHDDSMKINLNSWLIALGTGFALIDGYGTVYIFDGEGDFQDKFYLNSLKGYSSNVILLSAHQKQNSIAVMTYRDLEQVDDLLLAELNLEQRTFEILSVKKGFEETGFWLCRNNIWYFINTATSEIAQLDSQFHKKKVLVPKTDPILAVPDKQVAEMLKKRGTFPFVQLLKGGLMLDNATSFWRFHEKGTGNGPIFHQLILKDGVFSKMPHGRVVIAKYDEGVLEYNYEEREYSLIPSP